MTIQQVIQVLEQKASPALQENYDNAGLITGNAAWDCRGVLCTLDATEEVIHEAISKGCNLVIAHHPIVFSGLKKINGKNYVERTIIAAIKNDIAIYAIHTNLDNVIDGVNGRMADRLGLVNRKILAPKSGMLQKLYTFVPVAQAEQVRSALFAAGAGHIGAYSECSFQSEGTGTFKAGNGAQPFVGNIGERHSENELKLEVVFPSYLQSRVVAALLKTHPYEEPAFDIVTLANDFQQVGSGLTGELPDPMDENIFLGMLKTTFNLTAIKHTSLRGKKISRVALCGGAGSFLIGKAAASGADVYITADIKYHEFFDADGRLVIADIGHWESEQFTADLLVELLQDNFRTFAVLKSTVNTNPVAYFI